MSGPELRLLEQAEPHNAEEDIKEAEVFTDHHPAWASPTNLVRQRIRVGPLATAAPWENESKDDSIALPRALPPPPLRQSSLPLLVPSRQQQQGQHRAPAAKPHGSINIVEPATIEMATAKEDEEKVSRPLLLSEESSAVVQNSIPKAFDFSSQLFVEKVDDGSRIRLNARSCKTIWRLFRIGILLR